MTAPEKILSESAKADSAALAPLPASRKVYVEGSRPDIQVPMREITLTDTPTGLGEEKRPCFGVRHFRYLYRSSRHY